jgi:hypothetical protein
MHKCKAPETKSTAPPAKDQHPILEMESLTEEDKNRGDERNGSKGQQLIILLHFGS